ncbi:MJ0042-type zinc finger domain-containing protein [Aeromicrobium terrae]|nr:MJ0042-type zinc finger domain-containing protein [Aeromicrobium terrae]
MKRRANGYTVTCPYCRTKFLIGGYSPGLIRCGSCGKAFNLR